MQSKEKNSSWTVGHPKMGAIGCTTTSDTNYQFKQRKIPSRWKPEIELYITILQHETQVQYVTKILNLVIFVIPERKYFATLPLIMSFSRSEICFYCTFAGISHNANEAGLESVTDKNISITLY